MQSFDHASLSRISLLRDLSEKALIDLSNLCHWKNFKSSEQVIDRHSNDCDVYFVVQGSARVVNFSITGREVSFDDREAGGYFGELSALDGEPRSANVIALEDMTVARLSREGFNQLLIDHPQVTLKILRGLARIIRVSNNRIMDLSTLGANNRVHAEILRLAKTGVRDGNTARFSPFPIHGNIASRVSTTRETVNRVFSDLSRKGIVKRSKNDLVVLDVRRLTKMIEHVRGDHD